VLVGGLADPVDPGVVSDRRVVRVNHDNFIPLVHRILAHPIGIQYSKSAALTTYSLLGNGSEVPCGLNLVDTCILWFTVYDTFADLLLTTTTLHAYAVYNIPVLGLVPEAASLIGS